MNMLLVCGLWMLLSLPTANSIWCHECDKKIQLQRCPEIHEFCWSGERAGCYTQHLYLGGSLVKSEAGCLQNCSNETIAQVILRQERTCCFTDYCNE